MNDPSSPAEPQGRAILIANERAKLTATYVNGLAIAGLAVGGLAPIFAQPGPTLGAVPSAAFSGAAGAALHWAVGGYLKELR